MSDHINVDVAYIGQHPGQLIPLGKYLHYQGYFISIKEGSVWSIKSGVLKRLKYHPEYYNRRSRHGHIVCAGYRISHGGQTTNITVGMIKKKIENYLYQQTKLRNVSNLVEQLTANGEPGIVNIEAIEKNANSQNVKVLQYGLSHDVMNMTINIPTKIIELKRVLPISQLRDKSNWTMQDLSDIIDLRAKEYLDKLNSRVKSTVYVEKIDLVNFTVDIKLVQEVTRDQIVNNILKQIESITV